MGKRGSPALYELIRARGSVEPAAPSVSGIGRDEPPVEDLPGGWLRPGRQLRVPLGYVFVAVAITIVLASLTYMAGYSRGKAESRFLQQDDADRLLGASGSQVPRDPLEPSGRVDPPIQSGTLANHTERPSGSRERRWGPAESDPREAGVNYLILMETRRAGAERFIEFARERGLETYMVPVNNTSFRVFALPGFQDKGTEQAGAFREDVLRRIGEPWRQEERARDNPLGSSYWSVYSANE